jgi:hypothetical protein
MTSEQTVVASMGLSEPAPEYDSRSQLVHRIVASSGFARAPLLSKFLQYVCAETIEGRQEEISEYQVGVQVFDRPQGYRTIEDNIVRNYARQLRKRLSEYFETEGKLETLRVQIPLGGYVPEFFLATGEHPVSIEEREAAAEPAQTLPAALPPKPVARPFVALFRRMALLLLYSAALVCLTLYISARLGGARMPTDSMHPLWAVLFRAPLNTFVVPADCGFNTLEDLSHQQFSLEEYLTGNYRTIQLQGLDERGIADLGAQKFTSFIDLQVVSTLLRRPEIDPHRLFLRFPRDLRMDDLKTGNVILIGSIDSNPWAEVPQQNLNFRFLYGYNQGKKQAWISNAKPQTGEADVYKTHWDKAAYITYATIDLVPNLSGNGHILLIQGLDVAGTQAAAELLFREGTIAPILHKAALPDGNLRSFEIVIESTSIEANAANAQVIASRIN